MDSILLQANTDWLTLGALSVALKANALPSLNISKGKDIFLLLHCHGTYSVEVLDSLPYLVDHYGLLWSFLLVQLNWTLLSSVAQCKWRGATPSCFQQCTATNLQREHTRTHTRLTAKWCERVCTRQSEQI